MELYPDCEETMKYKMPTFEFNGNWISVANQKKYISVYTCGEHCLKEFKKLHPKIKTGKGCINFKDSDSIPYGDLEIVIKTALEQEKTKIHRKAK